MLYLDLIIFSVKKVISSVKSVATYIRQTIYMSNYALTIDWIFKKNSVLTLNV